MRAELKPQASERKSSGKGDKGHLVTKGFHLMSEKAKRKNCSRYVIQVKTYNHYAEKHGVYGDRLSFTEFTCRSVFLVTS